MHLSGVRSLNASLPDGARPESSRHGLGVEMRGIAGAIAAGRPGAINSPTYEGAEAAPQPAPDVSGRRDRRWPRRTTRKMWQQRSRGSASLRRHLPSQNEMAPGYGGHFTPRRRAPALTAIPLALRNRYAIAGFALRAGHAITPPAIRALDHHPWGNPPPPFLDHHSRTAFFLDPDRRWPDLNIELRQFAGSSRRSPVSKGADVSTAAAVVTVSRKVLMSNPLLPRSQFNRKRSQLFRGRTPGQCIAVRLGPDGARRARRRGMIGRRISPIRRALSTHERGRM